MIVLLRVASGVVQAPTAALRVGTSGDYPPFSFRDARGDLTGFDIAVARRLADHLGRPVEFVALRWPDLVTQLEGDAFDLAMSGVTVRPDRALHVVYTRPYALTGAVAVIRAANRRKFPRLKDLDRPTIRLGVNAGGHLEQVARQQFSHARLIAVSDNRSLPDLLRHGDIDAAVSEQYEARTWSGQDFSTLGPFTRDRKAYALPVDATALTQQVDEWLAAREADGWLNQQRRHWLGERAVVTLPQAECEALVAAIDLRLGLMPFVAAVKRREGLPIDDPTQEARVLDQVRTAAATARLNPDDIAELFRAQMEVAKAVQQAVPAVAVPPDLSLPQLRAAVLAASDRILAEVSRFQPWAHHRDRRDHLDTALRHGFTVPGVTAPLRAQLRQALLRVQPVP